MSFTTVSGYAHDNGYQLVIVIAGTTRNLLSQATGRLRNDLSTDGPSRRWEVYTSDDPDFRNNDPSGIRVNLLRWTDPSIPDSDRRTVLITVMKQHTHLDRVCDVLEQLDLQLDLQNVPALIFDDEADQASLNIEVQRWMSEAGVNFFSGI